MRSAMLRMGAGATETEAETGFLSVPEKAFDEQYNEQNELRLHRKEFE